MRLFLLILFFLNTFSLSALSTESDINGAKNFEKYSLKLGIKTDLSYYNDGLKEGLTGEKSSTATLSLSALEVEIFDQNKSSKFEYYFKFDLLSESPVNQGFTSFNLSKEVKFFIGKIRVNQGGWHVKDRSIGTVARGIYEKEHMPFDETAVLFAFSTDIAGEITLQFLNDPVKPSPFPDAPYWNSYEKQPAVTVEWIGEFGPFYPLLQLGSYDFSHSKYFLLGTKTRMSSLTASFDFVQDLRSHKVKDLDGYKNLQGILQSWSFNCSYEYKNILRPGLFVSSFDYREPEDENTNSQLVDYKGNNTEIVGEETSFNDNGYVWSISADYLGINEEVQPYIAIIGRSAKWIVPLKGIETKTDLKFNMGIIGRI